MWELNMFNDTWNSLVQSLSRLRLFVTPWTSAHQAFLSITNYQSLLKLMSIESVMPSNHLILWRPFLLLPSVFPSIRVFSNESALRIRWPKYWSFSLTLLDQFWLDLLAVQGTLKSVLQHHSSKCQGPYQLAKYHLSILWRVAILLVVKLLENKKCF